MINKIFLDMDDVLLDTTRYYYQWNNEEFSYNNEQNLVKTDGVEKPGLPWQNHDELPFEFWSSIPKNQFADDLISICENLVGEENVFILTSAIPNTACPVGKVVWVNNHLPKFKSKLFMGQKKHIVVDDRSLLIDDYEKHESIFSKLNKVNNFLLFPSYTNRFHYTRFKIDDTFKLNDPCESKSLFKDIYKNIISSKIHLINNKSQEQKYK